MTTFWKSAKLLLVIFLHGVWSEKICQLSLNSVKYYPFRREETIGCQPRGTASFQYEVKNLSQELFHSIRSRLLNYEPIWVSICEEWIDHTTVTVPTNMTLHKISPLNGQRQLSKTSGIYQILILRIIAVDSEPELSSEQLYNLTFVDDASLRGQMEKCSFQKLQIVPTEYGVLDVRVQRNATNTQHRLLVEEAYQVAKTLVNEDVDNILDLVDGVMVVVPPGTLGGWTAFGSFNGKHTSYNNQWAGYLGATMHEIGHNLGLPHAYENGVEYEDHTGYMGTAPQQMHYPRKCYNGPNHWHLGWYSRTLEIEIGSDTLASPMNVKLAAFVDNDMTTDEHYVIIKFGNYYMQYNRATKFNVDTSEMRDMVTIVESGDHKTNLVAGLDSQLRYWQSPIGIMVEICRVNASSEPNYVELSIGQSKTDCGVALTREPSIFPTSRPSLFPTPSPKPSDKQISTSTRPTLAPSAVPTIHPITSVAAIDPVLPSQTPTFVKETNLVPHTDIVDKGQSEEATLNPATNTSTIPIGPTASQQQVPIKRDKPRSAVQIMLVVISGALLVVIMLILRIRCRHRQGTAEERCVTKQNNRVPEHMNQFFKFIGRSNSNQAVVCSVKSDSLTDISPNTSIDTFEDERNGNLNHVDERSTRHRTSSDIEKANRLHVTVADPLRLQILPKLCPVLKNENGFPTHSSSARVCAQAQSTVEHDAKS